MAKTIINDTNLEITNFKVNKQNELEELQINGNEVSLGEESTLEDNKESTISSNGTFEIEPSTGYDGMKKVTATVDVTLFYAWKNGSSFVYTAKENVQIGTKFVVTTSSSYGEIKASDSQTINRIDVDETGQYITVTGNSTKYYRAPDNDIYTSTFD